MFKLIAFGGNIKHEFNAETLEEILSLSIDAFNQNLELHEIKKNEECLFLHGEIYELINKAVY